ncbi:hypothetical protein KA405_03290 [Patescibacteria group bacterium]|nr:hypothetical protein [Patescibacteria group bacterium]
MEQMDMFIDMGTIVGDDLDPVDIEEMMSAQAEFIDDEDEDQEMLTASSGGGDTLQLESDNISNDKKDKKKKDKKLTIEYFSTDLTAEAKNNALDPVI